jgi:hypothetical protein
MNLDIPNAAVVMGCASRTSFSAGWSFSEQSRHALEIACQTSGFKFLVQPRIRERQMTMTTANDIQDITPAANWRAPAIWVHNSSKADILRPAQPRSAEPAR